MQSQLQKILDVTNEQLDNIDMSYVNYYDFHHDTSYFVLPSGREHYRLLT